jgi:hypothetical protein
VAQLSGRIPSAALTNIERFLTAWEDIAVESILVWSGWEAYVENLYGTSSVWNTLITYVVTTFLFNNIHNAFLKDHLPPILLNTIQ